MRRRTDLKSLEVALTISSLLIWVAYSLAAIYVAYCHSFFLETDGGVVTSVHRVPLGYTHLSSFMSTTAVTTFLNNSRLSHPYNRFYYYIFPEGFDIAAFIPSVMRVLTFSAGAIVSTYFFAVRCDNGGEMLMVVAWVLGVLSHRGWLTSTENRPASTTAAAAAAFRAAAGSMEIASSGSAAVFMNQTRSGGGGAGANPRLVLYDYRFPTPPGWLWLAVSIFTGFFSGILCKVKDVVDGKHDRDTHIFALFDKSKNKLRSSSSGGSSDDISGSAVENEGGAGSQKGGAGELDDEEEITTAAASSSSFSRKHRQRQQRRHAHHHHHHGRSRNIIGIGDRLYMVVPFCTGQWFSFILKHGWRGIIVENGTIVLSLGMIGYTMLSVKLIRQQLAKATGQNNRIRRVPRHQLGDAPQQPSHLRAAIQGESSEGGGVGAMAAAGEQADEEEYTTIIEEDGAVLDVIDLVSKLFTTSFGVVVLVVVVLNIFLTSLLIPFLKALFSLNALVSSVGIIIELIVYEIA